MTELRSTSKTNEIDFDNTRIAISEEGKVILDFVHIDGEEHTVVLPRDAAIQFAEFLIDNINGAEE